MVKMIAGALIGLLIILLGIFVWYIYITTFVTSGNHVLFALSLIQIGIGVYILFRASKSASLTEQSDDIGMPIVQKPKTGTNILERNNEMMKEWDKNAIFKDKLKMVADAADRLNKKEPFQG